MLIVRQGCMFRCLLVAPFGHRVMSELSLPSGVERKSDFGAVRAAFDPEADMRGLPPAVPLPRGWDPKGDARYNETGLVEPSASNASMIRSRVFLSGATSDMANRLALAPATSLNANCIRASFSQASSAPGAIWVIL